MEDNRAASGIEELDRSLGGGFPVPSVVLVEGPLESAKARLLYSFTMARQGVSDRCVFVTRGSAEEVVREARAYGQELDQGAVWIAGGGVGGKEADLEDLASLSFSLKEILRGNERVKVRIAFDVLSPVLMRNSFDGVYRFLDQLIAEVKRHRAVLLATIEPGMHSLQVLSSIEQLFDGVLAVEPVAQGQRDSPSVRIRKMAGLALEPREPAESVGRIDFRRVAVLPFANMSPDPDDEYFADGMTEELIDRLAQAKQLRVIARTSVMSYKKKEKKISEIAKELGVGNLVEGSIRKAGNKARVTVQLVNSQSEEHLWSSRYDKDLDDIFEVQSDIATRVAEALQVEILSAEMKRIEKKPTENMAAYTAYLKGRSLYGNRMGSNAAKALMSAVESFEEAVKEDPDFALGYVGQADCWLILCRYTYTYDSSDYNVNLAKARAAVSTALGLDPTSAEAHADNGQILQLDQKHEEAEKEYRNAIGLNPSNADVRLWYSLWLASRERLQEALDEVGKARELNPMDSIIPFSDGTLHSLARDFEGAVQPLKRAAELGNAFAHQTLAEVYGITRRVDEMRREMATFVELIQVMYPRARLAADAEVARIEGDRETVMRLLPELEAHLRETGRNPAYWLALQFFFLGDNDKGFEWLERSYSHREYVLEFIKSDWNFDGVRTDPRYHGLVARLGLAK